MRSPIVAMLWENWRLSRVEAALRFGLGILAGSAAMVLPRAGATVAFGALVLLNVMFWLSIAKLNGGRFMDGYKPGFPLYLLYARPVTTSVFVGVAMAYDAVSCVALYLISAALLGLAFHQSLPLFSMALPLVAIHFVFTCIQWTTRNRTVQWIGSMAATLPLFFLFKSRVTPSLQIEFSLVEHAVMVLLCVVSFGLTVAGVARQRRGDSEVKAPRADVMGEYPAWLVSLFRFPCPTSTATRAQMWFELKSSGLPVLTMGVAVAIMIALLFAASIPIPHLRPMAIFSVMFGAPAMLLFLGGNAFGIRRRQGRAYLSAFEATQPYGTAQLASLKVLVRTACLLVALIVIGLSAWTSSAFASAWGPWIVGGKESSSGWLQSRSEFGNEFLWGLTGSEYVVQAVMASISVALVVISFAAFMALRARYAKRLLIAISVLLVYGLGLVVLALAERKGIASALLLHAVLAATAWLIAAAVLFATVYLLWSGLAERALTTRYVLGAVAISAAFGAACLPANSIASVLVTWLLPLTICVVAPWSLSRLRHM